MKIYIFQTSYLWSFIFVPCKQIKHKGSVEQVTENIALEMQIFLEKEKCFRNTKKLYYAIDM